MIAKRLLILLPFFLPAYLIRWRVGIFPTSALEVFLLMLMGVWLWERRFDGVREGWKRLGLWRGPVIAWFVTTLIAVFVAPSLWSAFGLWRAYVLEPLMIFVLMADVLRTEKDAEALQRSCFFVVIALAVWAAIQYATGTGIPHPWNVSIALGRRATGPFPFPNALCLFVAPVAAYAFVNWIRQFPASSFKLLILPFLTWLIGFLSLILARSEGAIAAFMVVAFIAMFLDRRWRWLAIVLGVTSALLVWSIPAWHAAFIREVTFQGWSGKVRLIMWRETLQMLKDHWFFGAGFGAYPTAIIPYHRATFIEIFQYPHNIFLNLWSEVGLLGLAVFGWILATWVFFVRRSTLYALRSTLLAPLFALLLHGLVDVPYFKNDLAVMFWILAALTTFTFDQPANER